MDGLNKQVQVQSHFFFVRARHPPLITFGTQQGRRSIVKQPLHQPLKQATPLPHLLSWRQSGFIGFGAAERRFNRVGLLCRALTRLQGWNSGKLKRADNPEEGAGWRRVAGRVGGNE